VKYAVVLYATIDKQTAMKAQINTFFFIAHFLPSNMKTYGKLMENLWKPTRITAGHIWISQPN
jgi:hypothetical protein